VSEGTSLDITLGNCTNHLFNSMEQNHSLEANRSCASQEIPRIL